MLFDLQSPGRKRVVQVVFGLLAVLFGVSFVFLGIGTGVSGSPLEAIGIGGADDPAEQAQEQIDDQQSKVDENPADKAALTELITLRYQSATQKYELDEETGATSFTTDAEEELERAADNWDLYLKAAGKNPDPSVALVAVQIFSALAQGQLQSASVGSGQPALDSADESLTNWTNAGKAQLIAASKGSPVQKAQAAEFFYFGGDVPAAEQAAQEALGAAPPAQTTALQKRLDAAQRQGAQLTKQIEDYRTQLAKATQGVPGAGAPDEPLGDLGGGALGGGGGLGGGGLATP